MSTPPSDADRIAAEGVPIPTTKGELRLVYGMRALRSMEDRYGSVAGLQEAMQELHDKFTKGDGKVAAFGPVCDLIAPGLLHLGYTEDQATDLLLPRHVGRYAEAMAAAMREAFPEETPVAGEQPGNPPAQVSADRSPGPSGTTSQPAAMAAATPTGGA